MIVAHLSNRTIAVSHDGYTWTEVTPGWGDWQTLIPTR